ncbi:MAG: hypothetical protein KGJ13_10815 [Patescibacteria group bacterium]|nr:hypothetical protein [Patescibacteria group bacterium]
MDFQNERKRRKLKLREVQRELAQRGYKCSLGTISDFERHGRGSANLKEALTRFYSESKKDFRESESTSLHEASEPQELDTAILRLQKLRNDMYEGMTVAEKILLDMKSKRREVSYAHGHKPHSYDPARGTLPMAVGELSHAVEAEPAHPSPSDVPAPKPHAPKRHNIE